VAYITDHDTFVGSELGSANDPPTGSDGVILLPGIEVSWKGEHIGLLGEEQASRRVLSANLHDLDLRDHATAGRHGARAPVVVWNHPRDPQLEKLPLPSGTVHAIEIANGALHGMDLVRWKRQQIIALARQYNLALLSGTDSHGWGNAAPNWTLLRLKDWRRLDRGELAARIEQELRVRGFGATRVVERATADPGTSTPALALSVILVPWRMLTALSADERRMWLVWTWGIAVFAFQLRRWRTPRRETAAFPAR
jgi:predicted metal-dependent phosphoesterase TrpH